MLTSGDSPVRCHSRPAVLVVSDQFLLFRVHGNHWTGCLDLLRHTRVDVLELGVTVGVLLALHCLAISLETVAQCAKLRGYGLSSDVNSLFVQLARQNAHALAGPPQGRFRIAARQRLVETFQSVGKGQLMMDCGFPPAPRSADAIRRNHFFCVQFGQTSMDGASRDTRGAGNEGNPAVAETIGLGGAQTRRARSSRCST